MQQFSKDYYFSCETTIRFFQSFKISTKPFAALFVHGQGVRKGNSRLLHRGAFYTSLAVKKRLFILSYVSFVMEKQFIGPAESFLFVWLPAYRDALKVNALLDLPMLKGGKLLVGSLAGWLVGGSTVSC